MYRHPQEFCSDIFGQRSVSLSWCHALRKYACSRVRFRALGRRAPLDLSLEFILSDEGAFVRSALVADLKIAAASSALKRVPPVFRRKRPRPRGGATATSTAVPLSPPPTRGKQRPQPLAHSEGRQIRGGLAPTPHRNGDEDPKAAAATTGREARAVSRKLLRKRALRGARRRPVLVMRVAGAVLAAAGRGIGTVRDCGSGTVLYTDRESIFGRNTAY